MQAMDVLEVDGDDSLEDISFYIRRLLRDAAGKAILKKFEAKDRWVSWRAVRDRGRLAAFLRQCRKHDVEVDIWFYDQMVDMSVN